MSTTLHKQTGGTLLGIIIGLVIGLGVAVVVAVLITKTPIPFMNKAAPADKPGVSASQLGDPNKPIYGKQEAAREAAKDFSREQAPVAPTVLTAPAAGAAPAPANTPAAAQAAKPGQAAPAAGAPAAAPAAAATAGAVDDKYIYFLQAGAFREMGDAEATRGKLALQGVDASISERAGEGGTLYRVRVGPFAQIDAMNKVRAKLADAGVDVAVVRTPK